MPSMESSRRNSSSSPAPLAPPSALNLSMLTEKSVACSEAHQSSGLIVAVVGDQESVPPAASHPCPRKVRRRYFGYVKHSMPFQKAHRNWSLS